MFKADLGLFCSHMTKTCFLLTSLGQRKPHAIWLLSHTRGGSRISEKGVHCIKVGVCVCGGGGGFALLILSNFS